MDGPMLIDPDGNGKMNDCTLCCLELWLFRGISECTSLFVYDSPFSITNN